MARGACVKCGATRGVKWRHGRRPFCGRCFVALLEALDGVDPSDVEAAVDSWLKAK